MRLAVVLPCWNAAGTLRRALDALGTQDVAPGTFEIIVVDDGSTDQTAEVALQWPAPVPLRVVRQPHRGLAAARNRGASEAQADVVLSLDPDVLARPGLIAAHRQHYADSAGWLAVQGRTVADPDTVNTPFMRVSTSMPDYTTRRPTRLSPLHVIGRNFSVSRAALLALGGFDEGFRGYGYEDVEFALRFERAGGRIHYEPAAIGLHHHALSLEAAVARQRSNGQAAVYFWRKYGRPAWLGLHLEIHPGMLPLKWLVFRTGAVRRLVQAVRPWAERLNQRLILNECYNHLLWRGYYDGVFEALRESR